MTLRWTDADYDNFMAKNQRIAELEKKVATVSDVGKAISKKAKGPNKTETEAGRMLSMEFPGCKVRYEPVTLHLENGGSYTADHGVFLPDGILLLVEVKNAAYKHASYGRSKMAFSQSRLDFPMHRYRWMEKTKEGWQVKDYDNGNR